MQFSDEVAFDHRDRKEVYDYVEQHGRVDYEVARRALDMDETAFGIYVSVLKREGYLEERDGDLRVSFDAGEVEQFSDDEGHQFVIRQATEEDRSGIVEVIHEAIGDTDDIVAENVADLVDRERVLLRHNELRSRVFFVATVADSVVGWVHLDVHEEPALDHVAELTVGVREEFRGHGIGSHLLTHGTTWAAENGIEKVYNSLPSVNERGIEWLESHGWEVEAVREDHYRLDGEYVDEVMMATWV
jgi:L-amino acid N-acyltransferase YncA